MTASIKIGVSACLLGEKVRFDGGHKHNRYITQTLERFFEFVPVCPESECGLGIPREAMRLEGEVSRPRLVTNKTRIDHTDQMLSWAAGRLDALEKEDLCGFIFKKDSPSSGHLPLIVPITLLNHFVRKYSQPNLSIQTYLNPHPLDLQLRNHV
jgi:uncharacterized protein YbbK (DUF523 family)